MMASFFRIAQHVMHNRDDSEDAVQHAFLKAYQHLGEFREDGQFSTWLIRITTNEALSRLRERRTIKEVSLNDDLKGDDVMLPRQVADWAPNPEEIYRASELRPWKSHARFCELFLCYETLRGSQ